MDDLINDTVEDVVDPTNDTASSENDTVEETPVEPSEDSRYTPAMVALFEADLANRLREREDALEDTVRECLAALRGYKGAVRPEDRAPLIDQMAAQLQNLKRFNDLVQARRYTKAYEFVASLSAPAPESTPDGPN